MSVYERPVYVMLTCSKEKLDERKVEFLDIYEDFEGRDILLFNCPECGETHKSLRFC